ncbi:hypothetical protein ACRALDRAFT_2117752 [Sodiomyces alcalophilus JCM 7366]|uniref:uncharacterized protein n=1 Tax=Sodiomyces alcalophilus JCM 7366 TaxID=591952 RepID=UPI0039B5DFB9
MPPRTDFPPVRACLFDMDGLLLDTEDIYTKCVNVILDRYGKPNLPWSVKARLQGRPGPEANAIFHNWAQLPIRPEQYSADLSAIQAEQFPSSQPLPGVVRLLADLGRTRYWAAKRGDGKQTTTTTTPTTTKPNHVHIALATSSHSRNFHLKTAHLTSLFSVFSAPRRVLGDDPRIPAGRGKPHPDIFLLALRTINESLPADEPPIRPEECLVFEDSVPGVEAGRRAGMRVIWCPHPMLVREYAGREGEVLAGRIGEAGDGADPSQVGEVDDGWAEYLPSLESFSYEKYGIVVPPIEVESEECMKDRVEDAEVVIHAE